MHMEVLMSFLRKVNYHRTAIVGTIVVIAILMGLLVIPSSNNSRIVSTLNDILNIAAILSDINDIELATQDMRVSARGYLISQNILFTRQYEQASERQRVAFISLKQHVSESVMPSLLTAVLDLEYQVDDWRSNRVELLIELVQRGDLVQAEQNFNQGNTQQAYEEIRRTLNRLRTEVISQRQAMITEVAERNRYYQYVYGMLAAAALVVMAITGHAFLRQVRLFEALETAKRDSAQLTDALAQQVITLQSYNLQLETLQLITTRAHYIASDGQHLAKLAQIVRQSMDIPGIVVWDKTNAAAVVMDFADTSRMRIMEFDARLPLVQVLQHHTASDMHQQHPWGEYIVTVDAMRMHDTEIVCGWIHDEHYAIPRWMTQHILMLALNNQLFGLLQREQGWLSAIFDMIPDGLIFINEQGRVLLYNQQVPLLVPGIDTGLVLTDVMRNHEYFAVGGRVLAESEYPHEIARQQQTAQSIEIIHQVEDERFPVRHRVIPVDDVTPASTVQGLVISLEDMRAQYELNRMQSDFVGMVSHELRTPLVAIIGAASMLATTATPHDSRQEGLLRLIQTQGQRLQSLIEDVLNISRIDREGVRLQRQQIDLQLLIRRYVGQHSEWGDSIKIPTSVVLPEVFVDVGRVEQILGNIFENARKYAPNSDIVVDMQQISDEFIQVTVRDYGVVLTPQEYEQIFQRFHQLPQHAHTGGVGLGLAICRYFVEAHGGSIRMQAAASQDGSEVLFTLPVAPSVTRLPGAGVASGQVRILVVEDDPSVQEMMQYMLTDQQYEVTIASTVQEAYRSLERWYFDVLVVDMILPDQSGLDFVRNIRTWLQVPIMMVTARSSEDDVIAGLRAGVDDYMIKPFSFTEFGLRIQSLLRRNTTTNPSNQEIQLGTVVIDFALRQVRHADTVIDFTPIEYRIFGLLATNIGQTVSHERMLYRIWGDRYDQETQYLWVHISHVRRKLRDAGVQHILIENVRGVGYRMQVVHE